MSGGILRAVTADCDRVEDRAPAAVGEAEFTQAAMAAAAKNKPPKAHVFEIFMAPFSPPFKLIRPLHIVGRMMRPSDRYNPREPIFYLASSVFILATISGD
jgi:hypothetical protein